MFKTLTDIRATFLDYFAAEGHPIIPSSSLVPRNDPTLMFTNSGMVQFKNVFVGAETRPYKRATTSQKCVRAGGKHNDLENVGYTARHLTFFEMLGNFSFGDYFKPEAIEFAWTLVTKHFDLPKDKLLVTVYHDDDEAAVLWKKIAGFSDDKIIRIHTDSNFWRMGETGPCGPCSEIFIDLGDKIAGGPPGSPDEDGDRFLEFWNLVFMQYEEQVGGGRVKLPKPSVDTGMGLERMSTILQGISNIFDNDLFKALRHTIGDLVKINPDGEQRPSFCVIADHLRSTAFLIADGVLPSNEGRGYVLRRIMRRAMRHMHMLGTKEPMIYRVVPELVRQMGAAYPDLVRAESLIAETLKLEESRFKQMLDRGLKLLDDETAQLKSGQAFNGEAAFKLYDTFGFPLDLTQDVLRGKAITVDVPAFEAAMARQKAAARAAWSGSGEAGTSRVWFEIRDQVGATEFLGYSTEKAEGKVMALVQGDKSVDYAVVGQNVAVIVNQTPFYAESGGQIGDSGTMTTASGAVVTITDTQKQADGLWAHLGTVTKGEIKVGENVILDVDHDRRANIRAHHSATHLLHEALRRALGAHVAQKGSLVTENKLRFDFSHTASIPAETLAEVEAEVNRRIRMNDDVSTRLMTPQAAMDEGAMALFGEKYGEEVRVVSMGGREEIGSGRGSFSVELCGGTHVRRTGDIGLFKIISESAVSSGVRRIEAVTAAAAMELFDTQTQTLQAVAEALKAPLPELAARATSINDERRKLEREVADLRRQLAMAPAAGTETESAKQINGVNFIGRVLRDIPAKDLKPMADAFKQQIGSGVVALASSFEDKVSLVVAVTSDLTGRFNAVDLVKAGAEAVGGKSGGGRPDMAQAGGTDVSSLANALASIEKQVAA